MQLGFSTCGKCGVAPRPNCEAVSVIEFPKIMPKWTWFLLFNVGTIAYLMISGALRWETDSVISSVIALLVMNGVAWISARKYKDWK